jgi:hypothetical protein
MEVIALAYPGTSTPLRGDLAFEVPPAWMSDLESTNT